MNQSNIIYHILTQPSKHDLLGDIPVHTYVFDNM